MTLESAPFVPGPVSQVKFFHRMNFQATTGQFGAGDSLDGGVLEIKIGSAPYVDFVAAGGSFNAGEGYDHTIANTQGNPLGGRMGWSGISQGSVHNGTLPSSASGQTVRLRWRLGTSLHTANQGGPTFFQPQAWIIDSVSVVTVIAPPTPGSQTITFTSAPSNQVKGVDYTPTATATSGLPVIFSIAAESSSVCLLRAGTTVEFHATGTCVIQADQPGNASYSPAPRVTQTVIVVKFTDTISFTSTAPANAQVGSTYRPTATTTYGRTVTFSIPSDSSSVCSIAGGVVTFDAVGTCVIQADQPGDADFDPATPVTQVVTVVAAPADQTISFTSTAPANAHVGDSYTPVATATSALPVTFSIAGSSAAVCSINGANLVSFTGVGSCVIQADQAGNASFNAAPRVTQSVSVAAAPPAGQTISFTSTAPANAHVGDSYTPAATATSGLAVTFSIAGSSAAVCSINGANLVSFTGVGSCVIQADQAGNASFNAAPQKTQSVSVAAAPPAGQTISFTSTAPANAHVGDSYTPAATATSALPVTFSIAGSSAAVCSINGANLVSFTGVGSCVIQADQAGNASFNAAPQVTQAVTVKAVQFPGAHMTLTNTAAPTSASTPAMITYTYKLVNDGTDTLFHVSVSDNHCSPVAFVAGDANGDQLLNAAETWTFTCSQTVTTPGTFTNTAQGAGFNTQTGLSVFSNTATATVTVAGAAPPASTGPHMTLSTSASPTGGPSPLAVTFTYTVVNDGIDTLFHVGVSDNACSPVNLLGGDGNHDGLLNAGETWTFTCSATLTGAGAHTSSATATGANTATGLAVSSNTAQATVTVGTGGGPAAPPAPGGHVSLSKAANPTSGPGPLAVTYTYTLVNDGTDTLFHVSVSDSGCSAVTLVSGDVNRDTLLQSGETWTFTCSATLTGAGPHATTATGGGTDTQTGLAVTSNTAQATVTVT